ncbi:MAG: restriction endonuclease subunit S [Treponema sp.]|nr:restriction endonuclease subunit S [Treponema sp.]
MATEWKKVRLGEICDYVTSGGTPLASRNDYYNPPVIPWLKTKEVNYSRITKTENFISQKGLDNSSAKLIPENSVIIAMYGQGDTAGRVAINKIPLTTNQACCNFIIDKEKADYNFIYYQLCTLYDKMVSLKSGGAQPNLNAGKLKELEISLPSLKTQQKIAEILSAYDDLIENNLKQIKLLEEASQKLYKEWFVKLNFPDHENVKIVDGVPEGWKKEKLINLVDVQYGYAFDGSKFNSEGNGKPIIRIRNIPQGTTDDFTTEQTTDDYIVHNGDIVVGMDGEFHINTWNQNDAYLVQRVCSFRPHNENIKGYILQAIYAPIKFFENTVVGATVAHLGKKHIDTIEVLTCNEEFYIPFQNMVRKRQTLLNQIQLLQSARDELLPKLMNGEYV